MGVYIEGMEMPVTCCHCPLMGYDPEIEWNDGGREAEGAYICTMTHELIDNTKREDHCPLVCVQTHGRLIDANALVDSFDPSDFWNPDAEDNCFAAVHVVNSAPTVLEAEEG